MLRLCLAAMGVSAAEALYVGDMVLDVDSAARAGIAVALVCGGSSPEADLRATGQRVLTRLDELLHLLPPDPPDAPDASASPRGAVPVRG
jgi:phosphoglycolate phosphatase-like HAD superfamily hydrolase